MNKLYTVFETKNPKNVLASGLTAEEAMHKILTYNGGEFKIREEEDENGYSFWRLYWRRYFFSRVHSTGFMSFDVDMFHSTNFISFEADEKDATRDIAEQVLKNNHLLPTNVSAIEDCDYRSLYNNKK